MSLTGMIALFVAGKVAKKAVSNGSVDKAINAVVNKIGKVNGQNKAEEYINKTEKRCLIIKAKSYTLGGMIGVLSGDPSYINDCNGKYQITDVSGAVIYKSLADNTITDREILNIYDKSGSKIGCVKEHLVSMGIPLLEKDVKKCSVFLRNEKIAELKKSICFGDLEFETLEGNVKILHQQGRNFQVKYRGESILKLHDVPFNMKDGYAEKYVMEYENTTDEVVAVLLAIAIDLINN